MDGNRSIREFILNNFITLKLESKKTNIYVAGERFLQCKHLLLISSSEIIGEKISSIDEVAEKLSNKLEKENEPEDMGLSPEEEFMGHCSNLQAWVEHEYDTRLLRYNLAFPLLKRLVEAGDEKARIMFKEEIARRYISGTKEVWKYLEAAGFLEYFSQRELTGLMMDEENLKIFHKIIEEVGIDEESMLFHTSISGDRKITGIHFSDIVSPPKSLLKLKNNLKVLNLSRIEKYPSWLGELKGIEQMAIYDASLFCLPNFIRKLKNLISLTVIGNIRSLPEWIGELTNLDSINLGNNKS